MPLLPKFKQDTAKLIAAKEPSHQRKEFSVELDFGLAQSLNADAEVISARQALEDIISEKFAPLWPVLRVEDRSAEIAPA